MADDIATTISPTDPIVKAKRTYTKKVKDTATDLASTAAVEAEVIKDKVVKQAKSAKDAAVKAVNDVDWKAHGDQLKETATKTAISAAGIAKDKSSTAMQSLSRLISDTAGTVDAKLGPQYGDYARYAAEAVSGAAKTLDEKDVDQLLGEARDFVRKSPAVAIGAAAVVGYVLMRLAKGSSDQA